MAKYRKKPVVIEAVHFDCGNLAEIEAALVPAGAPTPFIRRADGTLDVRTMEGWTHAVDGDWMIRGVKGEFYPCKPDIFAATYEPVDDLTLEQHAERQRGEG